MIFTFVLIIFIYIYFVIIVITFYYDSVSQQKGLHELGLIRILIFQLGFSLMNFERWSVCYDDFGKKV